MAQTTLLMGRIASVADSWVLVRLGVFSQNRSPLRITRIAFSLAEGGMDRPLWKILWYEFLRRVVQLTAVLLYRVRHYGVGRIPSEGPVLVVSNHQSHFDPPLIGMACPRRMNYLARETLFRFAPFRWLIQSLDAIPIDREGLGLNGIKESLRRLKRGEMVVIFPEGTRTPDGNIQPFRPGFTTLAVRARAAILPVAIDGAFQVWPRHQSYPRLSGDIRVLYGEPIPAEQSAVMNERELLADVERRVRQCHRELQRLRRAER